MKGDRHQLTGYAFGVLAARSIVADRREVLLMQMLFNLRVVVGEGMCLDDGYCFHYVHLAWAAFETWDGETPPEGWAKNPFTGQRGPCPCLACVAHRREEENRHVQAVSQGEHS